jgi:group I intron endonuclease
VSTIYSIYSAYNVVTKQRYIGFDSHWPKRKTDHKRESEKENNIKFYNAIKKYGWNNFIWEVLYQSKEKDHTLNVMESYFISEYDSIVGGYNTVPGGKRGPTLCGELNGMFGKTHTNEVKKKLSENAIKKFKNKSYEELYGKEKSDKLKLIRSEKAKLKNNSFKNNSRFDNLVYSFFNIQTGELIKCTRWVFYKCYNINKSGVSEIINKGRTYKNWCILY